MEVAMEAAFAAVVIAAMILTSETTRPAIVKGAAVGGIEETLTFLQEVWMRQCPDAQTSLRDVSDATFLIIGHTVLIQCGKAVPDGS